MPGRIDYMDSMKCVVKLIWESESECWRTETLDIPGLWLEADTFDDLIKDVVNAAPEFLEANCKYKGPIDLIFESVRHEHLKNAS